MSDKTKNSRQYFYCEACGFKKITGSDHGLHEMKTSPIPLAAPKEADGKKYNLAKYVSADGKIVESFYPKNMNQRVKVKCPKCGRAITSKTLVGAFEKAYEDKEKKIKEDQINEDRRKRMLDGIPDSRKSKFTEKFEELVGRHLPKADPNSKNDMQNFEKMIEALEEKKNKNGKPKEENNNS